MGCGTCQYFNHDGPLCGLGYEVTQQTLNLCDYEVSGPPLHFEGRVTSPWEYEANPKTIEQLPRRARTIGGQSVVHYSCDRHRLSSGPNGLPNVLLRHEVVTKGEPLPKGVLDAYFKQHFYKELAIENNGMYDYMHNYNQLKYIQFFKPDNAFKQQKYTKAARKDKVRLNGRTDWLSSIKPSYSLVSSTINELLRAEDVIIGRLNALNPPTRIEIDLTRIPVVLSVERGRLRIDGGDSISRQTATDGMLRITTEGYSIFNQGQWINLDNWNTHAIVPPPQTFIDGESIHESIRHRMMSMPIMPPPEQLRMQF